MSVTTVWVSEGPQVGMWGTLRDMKTGEKEVTHVGLEGGGVLERSRAGQEVWVTQICSDQGGT